MDSYLTQYYEHHRGEIPKNIVLESAMPDPEMYEQMTFINFCFGRRVHITVPQRGTLCQFVQLSRNNANEELAIRFNRTGREVQALEELSRAGITPAAAVYRSPMTFSISPPPLWSAAWWYLKTADR